MQIIISKRNTKNYFNDIDNNADNKNICGRNLVAKHL